MINLAPVWGLVLATIFTIGIWKFINNKTEKEVKIINVQTDEDPGIRRDEQEIIATQSASDGRVGESKSKRNFFGRWRIPSSTLKPVTKHSEGNQSSGIPDLSFKPFKDGI